MPVVNQHEQVDRALRQVERLFDLPQVREGGKARIAFAAMSLRTLKEFIPESAVAETPQPRCERGVYNEP
ncbi:hypothetical protein [Desulfovibrio oxyclinae]|jgi:hypothetical protein|uniref:hypothetical protein n=1 Tax=Desulfovibrio oxyclinae TaxID=63560 RepID=UPI0003653B4D|nr:hypothetical protein [Desulfovibrio oxyclinae]